MDKCIESLGESRICSKLDSRTGYWQIEIDERHRSKTVYTSDYDRFQFFWLSFALENAPKTLQRAMNVIQSSVKWQSALVYLDDIFVFSKNVNIRIARLRQVLIPPFNAGAALKLKKCSLFVEKTNYHGLVIPLGRMELLKVTSGAVRKLEDPRIRWKLESSKMFLTCSADLS